MSSSGKQCGSTRGSNPSTIDLLMSFTPPSSRPPLDVELFSFRGSGAVQADFSFMKQFGRWTLSPLTPPSDVVKLTVCPLAGLLLLFLPNWFALLSYSFDGRFVWWLAFTLPFSILLLLWATVPTVRWLLWRARKG